jgi:hypothetical protein
MSGQTYKYGHAHIDVYVNFRLSTLKNFSLTKTPQHQKLRWKKSTKVSLFRGMLAPRSYITTSARMRT